MSHFGSFDTEEYRKRIRVLRKLFGLNQTEFAKFMGIDYKKWNHYERGYPVSRSTVLLLREKIPGITMDWIYFGDAMNVEGELRKSIDRLERAERKLGQAKPGEQENTRIIPKVRRRIPKKNVGRRKPVHAAE